jgi:malonyl-ACP O-methyltransferase BioC
MPGNIARNFDRAAPHYDGIADAQAQIAEKLVAEVAFENPSSVLDIGSGTGFVAMAAMRRWPQAAITAMDQSPNMLQAARRKMPNLKTIIGDAAITQSNQKFDLILSSMMLHWLPDPMAALERWRGWLHPGGAMHVALLTQGSFNEWRDLCRKAGTKDGLWPMPAENFAAEISAHHYDLRIAYPSAQDFLRRLKAIGAATPHPHHKPVSTAALRRAFATSPRPFIATYRVLVLKIPAK